MFGWFQRLLPKTGDFFGMFEAHSATLVEAAKDLQMLAEDGVSPARFQILARDLEGLSP